MAATDAAPQKPIQVWTWPTPNGHKVHIMLEELGLPYEVVPINIGSGDQFKPEFLSLTPNHRIPAIVDPDGPEGGPFPCSRAAPSSSTSPRRPAAPCCRATRRRATAACNG
jgi:hypothetical protein